MVRTTEYSVLEDTLARRTFDESGDYVLSNPDLDVREHLASGNNRGIFSAAEGGSNSKLALGVSPFKAYVNGYEAQQLGTKFVDVDKARDFDTANNNKARFQVGNFVYVNNVYNSPDIGFVSGDTQAFKTVNLYDTATATDGTEQSTVGTTVPQIGRAKSRGFEYVTGTESNDIYPDSAVYKHYLFDVDMYTHINIVDNTAFTTSEVLSGASSGATGIVQGISATKSAAATSISVASPGVVTLNAHGFEEGQQITLSGGNFAIGGSAYTPGIYTVRNTTTNTFELYGQDGTTAQNVTAFTSGPTMTHGVVVLANVKGTFANGEKVTGQFSSNNSNIQQDVRGYKAVSTKEFADVKQIGMPGSPTYTADTDLSSAYGSNTKLDGVISVGANTAVTGNNTNFNSQLKPGDSISFNNDAGTTITRVVKAVVNNESLVLESASSGTTTNATATRQRAKLNNPELNTLLFKFPYETVKTLKTTANDGLTDTNYSVRRQFTQTLSSGAATISAGTNEVFGSLNNSDYTVSIMTTGAGSTGAVGVF